MLNVGYIMRKKVNNPIETRNKSTMLCVLFASLYFILMAVKDIFGEHWNENVKSNLMILQVLLSILFIWFLIKMERLSKIIKNDPKLFKQSKDERNIEIDYKSRSRGFVGMVAFICIYLAIAEFIKGLYRNTFLYDIKGIYIAMMILLVGGLVTAISIFFMEKE